MSHSQFPGQPGNQANGPLPPQPRASWPRRHKLVTALAVIGSLSVLIGVVVAVSGGGQRAAAPDAASRVAAEPTVTPLSPAIGSSAAARSSDGAGSASAPRPSGAATRSSGAAAKLVVVPNTVATYSGSGIETTPTFTTTATWQLAFSFNCSEFGEPAKVQVDEDGGSDSGRVLLSKSTLKTAGSTRVYDDTGSHYLKVDSPCSWIVKVVDES